MLCDDFLSFLNVVEENNRVVVLRVGVDRNKTMSMTSVKSQPQTPTHFQKSSWYPFSKPAKARSEEEEENELLFHLNTVP